MANAEYLDRGGELDVVTENPRRAKPIPVPIRSPGHRTSQIIQRPPK
jgi:hypothetical protein